MKNNAVKLQKSQKLTRVVKKNKELKIEIKLLHQNMKKKLNCQISQMILLKTQKKSMGNFHMIQTQVITS